MAKVFRDCVSGFTHMAGAVAAIVGAVFLGIRAQGDAAALAAVLIYGVSMTLLFSASTTYHLVTGPKKLIQVCQIVDHCMIYVLIAGTYTPIVVLLLGGWLRMLYLIGIWACALTGIGIKIFLTGKFRTLSTVLYCVMGSLIVLASAQIYRAGGFWCLFFLALGGVFYIGGAVFYARQKPVWFKEFGFHEIFHIFVLLGAFAHFAMIYWFVI